MSRKHHIAILTLIILSVGIIFLILAINGLKIYCPFNLITGLNCAGCGNTRAAMALSRLDFKGMLKYNLFFPLEMLYILRVYFISSRNYIKGNRFSYNPSSNKIDIIFLILLIFWTIVRNVIK